MTLNQPTSESPSHLTQVLILAGLRNATGLVLEEAKAMPLQTEPITDPYLIELMRQGAARGEARGEARALIRLVERRFGPLSPAQRDCIRAADSVVIEGWLDRVVEAPNLDAVFAGTAVN